MGSTATLNSRPLSRSKRDMKEKHGSTHRCNLRNVSEMGVKLPGKDHKYICLKQVDFEEEKKVIDLLTGTRC